MDLIILNIFHQSQNLNCLFKWNIVIKFIANNILFREDNHKSFFKFLKKFLLLQWVFKALFDIYILPKSSKNTNQCIKTKAKLLNLKGFYLKKI